MPEFPIPDSERILALLNPRAAGGKPVAALRRRLAGAFAARGVPVDLVESRDPSEALEIARAAAVAGYRAVAVAGGDGSVALALRATAGTEVPVAILPFGTGNQLARNFGIPTSLEGSVRVAVDGRVQPMDLGRIGEDHFALIAGAGLDADVMAGATSELKQRFGFAAYLYSGLKHAIIPKHADYHIVADGREIKVRASMVLLANVGLLGAGSLPVELRVGPLVSSQDGLIDVCVFAPRNLPEMARMMWKVLRQKYAGDERMIFLQARDVRIESDPPVGWQIDGELRGETPLEATVEPLASRILVPA